MPRTFVTGPISADDAAAEEMKSLIGVIPRVEPANGGPDDDDFLDAMEAVVSDDRFQITGFPDPTFTARAQYRVKGQPPSRTR